MSTLSSAARTACIAAGLIGLGVAATAFVGTPRASAEASSQDGMRQRLRLIRHMTTRYGNPAALIRAANYLRPHKKDEVLIAVCTVIGSRYDSAFLSAAGLDDARLLRAALPDPLRSFMDDAERRHTTGDPGQLLILAALKPLDDARPPSKFLDQERSCSLMGPVSKSWPVVFVDDVPYDLTGAEAWAVPEPERQQCYSNALVRRNFLEFVFWADSHSASLGSGLVPPDAIFDVVDEWLMQLPRATEVTHLLGDDGIAEITQLVRGQTIRMTEGVLDELVAELSTKPLGPAFSSSDLSPMWPAYKDFARSHRLRWNHGTQTYELGG